MSLLDVLAAAAADEKELGEDGEGGPKGGVKGAKSRPTRSAYQKAVMLRCTQLPWAHQTAQAQWAHACATGRARLLRSARSTSHASPSLARGPAPRTVCPSLLYVFLRKAP